MADHKISWDSHIKYVVWENRVSPKRSTGNSCFQLVYGTEEIFPTQLTFPVAKFVQEPYEEGDDFSRRINHIIELNEDKYDVQHKLHQYQNKMKSLFDKMARERYFR